MSDAPERVYMDPDILFPECDKQYGCDVEYVRADILQHQTNLIEQLFALLDVTEQKDDGRYFHPNVVRSSRALDAEKLETILAELKATVSPVSGVGDTLLEVSVISYPMLPKSKFEVGDE